MLEIPRKILRGYINEGMTVLDVGCGQGHYSLGMARLVGSKGRIVSVDSHAKAIEALRRRAEQFRLSERIELRVCSEQDLEIDDLAGQVDFELAV